MRSLILRVLSLLSLSFLASSLAGSSASAALSTDANSALSFFRSRESQFPSGQASRIELENKILHTELEFSYRVSWDNQPYVLESDQILRDIQTSHFVETKSSCELLINPFREAQALKTLAAKVSLEVLETESYWARVREKNSSAKEGWIPLHLLQTKPEDTGVYVNLIDTYLRKGPTPTSGPTAGLPTGILTTIPRLHRILPLALENGFLKIKYANQIGYADINNFVSRADFANLAYSKKGSWMTVSHRNGTSLVTKSGQQIPLRDILGYVTNSHRGVVMRASGNTGPQLLSRVEILKSTANVWAQSKLEEHGEVWWKKSNLLIEDESKSPTTITTDELMKREIYSIAFESKDSLRGLVSSEGVYRTENGLTWTLLPFFGKQNYPVNIHPNGNWFIGSYKSVNEGKSFDPFIRWEQIAQAIESALHRNPKVLRLTQIEALPNSQVQIHVDTGVNKIKLRSSLSNLYWSVVK